MSSYRLKFVISFVSVLAIQLAGAAAASIPHSFLEDPRLALVKERQSGTFAITGVNPSNNGPVPLRLEIRDMQKNADLFNLYLLGMDRFQQVPQDQLLSYYQIAGIHGRPYIPWDGVQAVQGGSGTGYCTHSSVLFLTWHRPFLALFEQALYNIIQQIAAEFPSSSRARYQAAAQNFRIPYWDWAANVPSGDSSLPLAVGLSETVQVITPTSNGQQTSMKNPLFSYKFNPVNSQDFPDSPFNVWPQTLRDPTSSTDPRASSQNSAVDQMMNNARSGIRNNLYTLFSAYHNFNDFSNNRLSGAGSSGSLEGIHDNIHGIIGSNGGHMGYLDYAAFDPLFWLHHANVDRCFALWQAINPNAYLTPATASGTFTNPVGSAENEAVPLTPFHNNTSGSTWDSDGIRSTTHLGYAYPETQRWNFGSDSAYQAGVTATINKLYGPNARANNVNNIDSKRSMKPFKRAESGNLTAPSGTPTPSEPVQIAKNGTYNEWIFEIRASKHVFGTSYKLYLFLGEFNSNSEQWPLDPNLVGMYNVFTAKNAPKDHDVPVSGALTLTSALITNIKAGKLTNLDEDAVVPYLQKNMKWRVVLSDGTVVDNDKVPDLTVAVVSNAVTPPKSQDQLPTYSAEYKVHPSATEGQPTGYSANEPW